MDVRGRGTMLVMLLLMQAVATGAPRAQAAGLTEPLTLPALLSTAGPILESRSSAHFILYSEFRGERNAELLDSLEGARSHAMKLLGATEARPIRAPVIVTASRTRLSPLLRTSAKGLRGTLADGSPFILLRVTDDVRPYTRHEVMHDVAFTVWGPTHSGGSWLSEGLATFADGACQGVPNVVVARDVLNERPDLTLMDLSKDFWTMTADHRHAMYVLAASVVEFLWRRDGRDVVRRLWQTGAWPSPDGDSVASPTADLSSEWRAYVRRAAGAREGLTKEQLGRDGCG